MLQIAEHDVEGDGRPCMTQMRVAIDCWTADVHADIRGMKGFEALFLTGERIVDNQF
jgi:hypothetical protein